VNDTAPAIHVSGLTKSFGGKRVVDNVALEVPRGMIFGFLGPNGSGKTTTIRMLCGLLTPDSGEGSCLGYDIHRQALQIKRRIGYMTQRFGLYEDMTVRENLEFIGRLYGVQPLAKRTAQIIAEFGFTERVDQLAGELSGGWKQRLALAACVLHKPEMLLLDEPTAGVDPNARREFWDMINALAAQNVTVLVSTHYMDEAVRCNRIAYLASGKLLLQGTVDEVIDRSGLTAWTVTGLELSSLQAKLKGQPGIDMIAAFGNALHVTGTDAGALERAITPYQNDPHYRWDKTDPSLEDVFIYTISKQKTAQP
jgi:ABC-2 type transport system ATP-binding protein